MAGTSYIQFNDESFIDAVDMKVLHGRNFERDRASDSSAIMVNESFLRKMNVFDREAVIGKQLQWGDYEDAARFTIIGIVKDFNRTSMKSDVEPTIFFPDELTAQMVSILICL